jgi:quercetin dioxygenase-like cupin family protein
MKKILIAFLVIILSQSAVAAEGIKVDVLAKSTKSWDGSALPAYTEGQPEITILKIEIQPGVKLPLHHHPVINMGVLTKGELTVISKDNEVLQLKAGDSIVEVVNKEHYGENRGDAPAEIIVVYAGVKDEKITIYD